MDRPSHDHPMRPVTVRTVDNLVVDIIPPNQALRVKRLTSEAVLPRPGSSRAIGYDLHASAKILVPAGEWRRVPTGIAVAIPAGFYGRVAPRSGLAVRSGIGVLAGVIDADYRGEIQVVLINHSNEAFWANQGERIAQLIMERAAMLPLQEVEELDDTARGAGGFGSSGL